MKIIANIIIVLAFVLLITSCRLMGPPFPRKQATKFLEEKGTSSAFINRVINKKNLTSNEFYNLSKSQNESVRFLIASNRYIPKDLLKKMAMDESTYVRQGIASNISIDNSVINILKKDNVSVQGALVENPLVPSKIILELYRDNKDISLASFALNPNCPEEIKKDIHNSKDSRAKKWLKDVERWKKEGKYDSKGAWIGG